jgi:membrane-associated protease RseP (regulator of RpoE activity)
MHVILAFVLLFSIYSIAGAPVGTAPTILSLAQFSKGLSPAQRAGLKAGDAIVAVNGHEHPGLDYLISFVNKHSGDTLSFVVDRRGHDLTLKITPVDGRHVVEVIDGQRLHGASSSGPATGIIGVALTNSRDETVGPFVAIGRAGTGLVSLTGQTFSSLAQLFSLHGLGSFAHQVATAGSSTATSSSASSPQLLSIVGAVQIGAQALRRDVPLLLYLLAAINLFVGIVNLFPMLPLDGGHVAIAVYERIRSRKGRVYHADVAKLMPVAYVFLLFVVIVGLGALYMNIVHPAQLPGG